MANRKITELTALTTPAADDVIPIVDISETSNATKNKKITVANLIENFADIDLKLANGTEAAPSLAFTSATSTGLYRSAANELSIATNGGQAIKVEANNKTTIYGDLVVTGGTTTISSTQIDVTDKNLQLATGNSSDAGADGGGLTLKGATDKTWNWVDSTDAWTANQHIDVTTGKVFKIAGTEVLNATTLGSGVVSSSLTSVGTLGSLTVTNAVTAGSLDISGGADIDGTLEADAYTVNGTALNEYIADTVGAMVSSNTETNIVVTYNDSDNTLDFVISSYPAASISGTTLASNVVTSSLTSVGTLGSLNVTNTVTANLFSGSGASLTALNADNISSGTLASARIEDSAITSAKIEDGAIVNADINASAAIAGTKINPNFGSQAINTSGSVACGNITIANVNPKIFFTDTDTDSDFSIRNNNGVFTFYDQTNSAARLTIASDGTTTVAQNLDVGAGVDVTGNITVTGTVDGRDVAADGTKLDTYAANGSSYLRSDADDSFTGTITAVGDTTNPVLLIKGTGPNFIRFDSGDDPSVSSDSIDLIYRSSPNTLGFERVSDNQTLFSVDADTAVFTIQGNLDANSGIDTTNITVTGTVDGVDIAARDTLFGGLTSSSGVLSNGVTATTQSANDNSTKVATTAYTDTAISNLVDSSPSALNTLNELAAALGDDANFSTTVTNSIATKLPLAGGTLSGTLELDGDLWLDASGTASRDVFWDSSESILRFYNSAKATFGNSDAFQLFHNGTRAKIQNNTGELRICSDVIELKNYDDDANYLSFASGGNATFAGSVTATGGFSGSGASLTNVNATTLDSIDSGSFLRSDANDTCYGILSIAANKAIDFITGTWTGNTSGGTGKIQAHDSALYICGGDNGIRFREHGTDRWYIDGSGHFRPHSDSTYNIGSSSHRVANGYFDNITITNDGSGSGIDADTLDGVEGSNYLRSNTADTMSAVLTLSSDSSYPLTINGNDDAKILLEGSSNPYIRWREGSTNKAYLQFHSNGMMYWVNQETNTQIRLGGSPAFYDGSNYRTIWHVGNTGSGSGLDADVLDGVQASSFLRSDATDTCSGQITFTNTVVAALDGDRSTQGGCALVVRHGTNTNMRGNHFIHDDYPSGKATYYIQATESGVSNDRNLCLQGYGGKVKIGATTAPTEVLDVAGNIKASGTITGTGSGLTGLNASNLSSGTVATARLGSGTASSSVFLRGDGTWAGVSAGDATLLDGLDSTQFLRSDTADSMSATLTLNNASDNEKIILAGSSNPLIRWQEGTTDKAYIQWNSSGFLGLYNQEDASSLLIKDDITFSVDGSTYHKVFHAGNDGSGSGLDADTLDGIQASSFVRSDSSGQSIAGNLTVGTGASSYIYMVDSDNGNRSIHCNSDRIGFLKNDGNWGVYCADNGEFTCENNLIVNGGNSSTITMGDANEGSRQIHNNSNFIGFLKANGNWGSRCADDGSWQILGNTAWHAGNDGSGSGLDADLLDGVQGTNFVRSDQGDTLTGDYNTSGKWLIGGTYSNNAYNSVSSTRLLFGGGNDQANYHIGTNLENYGGNYTKLDLRWHTGIRMGAQSGYGGIRFYNNEDLNTLLFSVSKGDANTRIESGELYHNSSGTSDKYWHESIDGSGSGLDADKFDGLDSTTFLRQESDVTTQNWNDYIDGTEAGWRTVLNHSGSNRPSSSYTYGTVLSFAKSGQAKFQLYAPENASSGNNLWYRTGWNTSYRAWVKLLDSDDGYWSSGNDGSGSGLDADTVDGVQASSFLRSETADSFTQTLSYTGQAGSTAIDLATNDGYGSFRVIRNYKTSSDGMYIGYNNSNGGVTRIFGGGAGSGGVQVSGSGASSVTIAGHTVWNAGNFPKGNSSGAMCQAYNGQGQMISGNTIAAFSSTRFNIGSHYNTSNGRFTAPHTGRYLVAYSGLHDNQGQGSTGFEIRINNNTTDGLEGYANNPSQIQLAKTAIVSLSANDYVSIFIRRSGTRLHQRYGSFSVAALN